MGLALTAQPRRPRPAGGGDARWLGLLRAVARQLIKLVLLLAAVSIVVFGLIAVSPIDPIQVNSGTTAYLNMSPEKRAQLAEYWGTNLPIWRRYLNWAGSFISGDMGISLKFNQPVAQVIAHRFRNSAVLLAAAWLLSGVLGFVLGVVAGMRRDSWVDRAIKSLCFVFASTPTFWFGMVMLMVFSVELGWFPFGLRAPIGTAPDQVSVLVSLHHLVLPVLTLAITGIANITLHTREKLIDVIESDYFGFARARGESLGQAVHRHGLRNILLPALTLQFAVVSEIFGGSVLVEQVFSYPGLGKATIDAGIGGDAALLAGISIIMAAVVFAGNLTANLLYGVIDPRIRRGAVHG